MQLPEAARAPPVLVVMSGAREALVASERVDARERLAKPFDLERLVAIVRPYA